MLIMIPTSLKNYRFASIPHLKYRASPDHRNRISPHPEHVKLMTEYYAESHLIKNTFINNAVGECMCVM